MAKQVVSGKCIAHVWEDSSWCIVHDSFTRHLRDLWHVVLLPSKEVTISDKGKRESYDAGTPAINLKDVLLVELSGEHKTSTLTP